MEEVKWSKYVNLKWIIASVLVPLIIAGIGYWATRQSEVKSPGSLEILDIQVQQTLGSEAIKDPEKNKCLIDFRVSNKGGTTVLVNKVQFKVLDIVTMRIKGYLDFSKVYDLDISALNSIDDIASVSVSQEIKGGEVDRFGIALVAKNMPHGVERGWRLQPTLFTKYGEVAGNTIEVWFPYEKQSDDPEYFAKAKQWEKEEREAIKAHIEKTEKVE